MLDSTGELPRMMCVQLLELEKLLRSRIPSCDNFTRGEGYESPVVGGTRMGKLLSALFWGRGNLCAVQHPVCVVCLK